MKDNKQILKESALGLAKTFLVLFCIMVFKLSFFWIAVIILTLTALTSVWKASRGGFHSGWVAKGLQSMANTLLVLFIVTSIYKWLGDYTLLAFLVVVLLVSGLILWNKRKEYMEVVRHTERQIWGSTAEERRDAKKNNARRPYG